MAAIVLVTIIGVLSVKLNAWVTGIFLAVEIASLLVTAWLGFSHAHSPAHVAGLLMHPQISDGAGGLRGVAWVTLGVGASAGIYAMNGYGSVVALGEEIRDARRGIGPVIAWAIALGALVQILPSSASSPARPTSRRSARRRRRCRNFSPAWAGPRCHGC